MLSVLSDMKSGEVGTFEIPSPELRAGGALVHTAFSAISAGTESTTIDTGKKSLLGKALARPDLVRQVLDFAKSNGVRSAYQKVQSRLDTVAALGYSCSGTVLATADGVTEVRRGHRVACAGAGYASHSEINFIPRNLMVRIPDQVSMEAASLTTIGAIAMQGFRQAGVSLGETVVVIGAGLLGVLAIQLARAAGCRAIAIDANPSRAEQALEFGATLGLTASDPSVIHKVAEFTKHGADAALITAGANTVEPVELGAKLLRDRGRVVVVGAVPLGVSRDLMYRKELSLVLSRSYGPGRYDSSYEELGHDYPIGYVRWTEQRNMHAFLEFLSTGAINVEPLLRHRYKIEDGARAYSEIRTSGAYTAILEYEPSRLVTPSLVHKPSPPRLQMADLRVGCIGAGSFARGIVFPKLRALPGVQLETVAAASGASAYSAQKMFHFRRAEQPSEVLASADVDAIFVLSRHDSHARFVISALSRQKPVFVEKPLALNQEELDSVCNAYAREQADGGSPFVMVGFNRRFSPAADKIRAFFGERREPLVVQIRVNAGHLPREHWIQQPEGGGRIIGEVCHFLDFARSLVGSRIQSVCATAIPDGERYKQDNAAITISFADGSIGNILYVANGDRSLPKEFCEIFCGGAVARLDDFRSLELFRNGKRSHWNCNRDKGHAKELELTVKAIRAGGPPPIPFSEIVEVTEASYAVVDSINYGLSVQLTSSSPAREPLAASKDQPT